MVGQAGPTLRDTVEDPRGSYARIYAVVRAIPRGRVATYGQVAILAGMPGRARQVGYALHSLSDGARMPWQRVINAGGRISFHPDSMEWAVQRTLLEAEGIEFGPGGCVSLERFRWRPRAAGRRSTSGRKGR